MDKDSRQFNTLLQFGSFDCDLEMLTRPQKIGFNLTKKKTQTQTKQIKALVESS